MYVFNFGNIHSLSLRVSMIFFDKIKLNFLVIFSLFFITNLAKTGSDPLIETAEALLSVVKQQKGYSDFSYDDSEDPAKISQTVAVEREVNRSDFTGMLVETNRDEFIKLCDKCKNHLEKWTGIEKALIEEKPSEEKSADKKSESSSNRPNFLKKLDEKKEESKPAEANTEKPAPFSLFKKEEEKTGRKPLDDIKPPLFPSLSSKLDTDKPATDFSSTTPTATPPADQPKEADSKKPPFGLKKLTLGGMKSDSTDKKEEKPAADATPAKPEEKPAEAEKKDDKKPEDSKPLPFKMRTLRPLGRKGDDKPASDASPAAANTP